MPVDGKEEDNNKVEEATKQVEGLSITEDAKEDNGQNHSAALDELMEHVRRSAGQSEEDSHKFWSQQPMRKQPTKDIGRYEVKSIDEIRKEPYSLPSGFEWDSIDIDNDAILQEVYDLLNMNYVEDDDNMFRFDYSMDFINWALRPPGYYKDWIVGLRQSNNKKLLAFITGIPAKVHVFNQEDEMAEINFLCIHKKLRSKRLAPVLIKEVTRRVNLTSRWTAVYTAGALLPTPIAKCQYYHRSINPVKLINVGFSSLAPRMTMQRTVRLYKLPDQVEIPGFRAMTKEDVPKVTNMLKAYLDKFKCWIQWSEDEVSHWLLPRKKVVDSFVVATEDGTITDFCSYYHIPSTVVDNPKYKTVNAVYSFYNVANSLPLKDLMQAALIKARDDECDVFNCLDIMDNMQFVEDLKFGKGDGFLHYYLYNYNCPDMKPAEVGIVLL